MWGLGPARHSNCKIVPHPRSKYRQILALIPLKAELESKKAPFCFWYQPHGGLPKIQLPRNFEGNVAKFAPHKALKLITWGEKTFNERFVVHRVVGTWRVSVRPKHF